MALVLKLLGGVQVLHIDGLHHLLAVDDAGLLKLLTLAQLLDNASALGFSLKFLQGALDVLAFFNWNDNHDVVVLFISVINLFFFCFVVAHGLLGRHLDCGPEVPTFPFFLKIFC